MVVGGLREGKEAEEEEEAKNGAIYIFLYFSRSSCLYSTAGCFIIRNKIKNGGRETAGL